MTMLARLRHDESGTAAVLVATALPPLLGFAALCIDFGYLYLAERQLQNLADDAATAAVNAGFDEGAEAAMLTALEDSHLEDVSVFAFEEGEYRRDPEIAWHERFDADSLDRNAAHVVLQQEVPLFLGSLLTEGTTTLVTAEATATRRDMAGFRLGSRLVAPDGMLANALLSGLAGTDLGLTQDNVNALTQVPVPLLDFAQAVNARLEEPAGTLGGAMEQPVPLFALVEAMADASPDPQVAELLRDIASQLGGDTVIPAQLIELGALGMTDINDGRSGGSVDAFALLRSLLQAARGEDYDIALGANVAGLASVTVRLAGGTSEETSPWLTLDAAGDVTLRTAQTRLLVQARTKSLAGLPVALEIPLYTELAAAEARISDIVCGAGDGSDGVIVEATPSVGTLALARPDTSDFGDFSSPVWLEPAVLLNAPLAKVRGFSEISLGGVTPKEIHFSPEEIAQPVTKTVGTTDAVQTAASSLVRDVDLSLQVAGIGLGSSTYTTLVGNALGTLAPSLDTLMNQLTGLLGVKLGAADVTVDRLRCGIPTLVG
ncbi:pilus assembly protein TadG-related protein [Aurantiacibacter luteus]|nr:pilus assembly protein TadG-related protein [Aurantiacibacter luteus]